MKIISIIVTAILCHAAASGAETTSRYFVPPVSDRQFWQKYRNPGGYLGNIVKRARQICQDGRIAAPRAADYSKDPHRRWENGSYEAQYNTFHNQLRDIIAAYCLTGDHVTFREPLEKMLRAACDMRGWSIPAFDKDNADFNGKAFRLDLYSAPFAGTLGAAAWLFKSVLPPELHERVVTEINRRVLVPFEKELAKTPKKRLGWIDYPGNWNAVCLAGITMAAATTVEDEARRRKFFAAAQKYSQSYLDGFTADGYTSEGVDYWNYGFSFYLQLAMLLRQNSGGAIDLFANPHARAAASFPDNIRITETIYPSYSDSQIYSRCSKQNVELRDWMLGRYAADAPISMKYMLGHLIVSADGKPYVPPLSLRSKFPEAGVYNFRPGQSSSRLSLSCKGGHNNEGHNHNDIGSYIIALDGTMPIVFDPGAEEYTKRTFSDRRHESNLLNSYGHSVPVAAGLLQGYGRQYCGKLLKESHSDLTETLLWDLAAAYPAAAGIEKLTREIIYNRTGAGSVSVIDAVEFSRPAAFATAAVTPGKLSCDGKLWKITCQGKQLTLKISAVGGEIVCRATEIKEKSRSKEKVSRLEISFTQPVKKGAIRIEYLP